MQAIRATRAKTSHHVTHRAMKKILTQGEHTGAKAAIQLEHERALEQLLVLFPERVVGRQIRDLRAAGLDSG